MCDAEERFYFYWEVALDFPFDIDLKQVAISEQLFFCDFYKAYTSRWATSIKSLPIDSEWGILYSEVVSDFHSGMCVKRYAHSKY